MTDRENISRAIAQLTANPGARSRPDGMMMTPMQYTALANHCRLAGEVTNPLFHAARPGYSLMLTVNSGYE